MKSKFNWLMLSCLLAFSLILASCGTKTTPTSTTPTTKPTTAVTTAPTTTPTTKPTTTATTAAQGPTYGGELILRTKVNVDHFDSYYYGTAWAGDMVQSFYAESLGTINWALDRNIWNFQTRVRPTEYRTGLLAESYEQPDLATVIFHLHKGIKYQDLPPVNGREFTADDVVYHYNRELGLGSGFTTKSPYRTHEQYTPIVSVTANDKYTVTFKYKSPSIDMLDNLLDDFGFANIIAKEVVQQYGNMEDWHHAVGTGPFLLKDYVSGSSVTLVRNPTYWGYDARYPQNQLPYMDKVRILIIPDDATALAGLRTGKVDLLGTYGDELSWVQAKTLKGSSPEIMQIARPTTGVGLDFRVDKTPFTDIRVRKAMQMAINLDDIAKSYYGGTIDGTPYGQLGPAHKGFYTPFAQWPADVKAGYAYNPEGAKKLLAEAGYPTGFKTNVVASSAGDLDILQIAKDYFLKIGVDMEIRVMDPTSFNAFTTVSGKHDQMVPGVPGGIDPARICLNRRVTGHPTNLSYNNDPAYDAIVNQYYAATDAATAKKVINQADDYAIAKEWRVVLAGTRVIYTVFQPWLKGYAGEYYNTGVHFARFWIDRNLKKSMGR
jgi:peptide/nickel transport system substrate-binding protein